MLSNAEHGRTRQDYHGGVTGLVAPEVKIARTCRTQGESGWRSYLDDPGRYPVRGLVARLRPGQSTRSIMTTVLYRGLLLNVSCAEWAEWALCEPCELWASCETFEIMSKPG